jgi:hypothetical protein
LNKIKKLLIKKNSYLEWLNSTSHIEQINYGDIDLEFNPRKLNPRTELLHITGNYTLV